MQSHRLYVHTCAAKCSAPGHSHPGRWSKDIKFHSQILQAEACTCKAWREQPRVSGVPKEFTRVGLYLFLYLFHLGTPNPNRRIHSLIHPFIPSTDRDGTSTKGQPWSGAENAVENETLLAHKEPSFEMTERKGAGGCRGRHSVYTENVATFHHLHSHHSGPSPHQELLR